MEYKFFNVSDKYSATGTKMYKKYAQVYKKKTSVSIL